MCGERSLLEEREREEGGHDDKEKKETRGCFRAPTFTKVVNLQFMVK